MFSVSPTYQPYIVFLLISMASLAMLSNRIRYDFIAIGVAVALVLTGILPVADALSGFGNPVVILIAGLLVVGEMLERTGVAKLVGESIYRFGQRSSSYLLAVLMLFSAVLSAIMSSTAVVAIFIPIVLGLARRTGQSPSALLLPMSFAALVSGMLTLIATPPNLVISAELESRGYGPLSFFSFSLPGLVVLLLTIGFTVLAARRLLPQPINPVANAPYHRRLANLLAEYQCNRRIDDVKVGINSQLCDKTIAESGLYTDWGVRILGVARLHKRERDYISAPGPGLRIKPNDILHVCGSTEALDTLRTSLSLTPVLLSQTQKQFQNWELGATAVLIHPNSRLIGKTIKEVAFRDQYHLDVLGIRRNKEAVDSPETLRLEASDSLLVTGAWTEIKTLQNQNHDFVLLEMPAEANEIAPAYRKMPVAITLTLAMVLASVLNLMPLVIAVLLVAIVGVATRCLSATDAYRAIHWQTLVLLAGMLPLADALDKTGGTTLIVDSLLRSAGHDNPQMLLALLFAITALLTNFLSNTASAVLMAPIAVTAAEQAGVSPYPFAITVLFAASAAFMTPVASPVVTLVVEPGRYRFIDFVKLGTPLLLMVFAICYFVIPWYFPW